MLNVVQADDIIMGEIIFGEELRICASKEFTEGTTAMKGVEMPRKLLILFSRLAPFKVISASDSDTLRRKRRLVPYWKEGEDVGSGVGDSVGW